VFNEQTQLWQSGRVGDGHGVYDQRPGDDVFLSNNGTGGNLGGYREHVDFGAAAPSIPFGVYTKSTGGTDFVAQSTSTPGSPTRCRYMGR